MPLIEIDSIDDPRLAPYQDIRYRKTTKCSELFIAEGRLLVERLVQSDLKMHSILVDSRYVDSIAKPLADDVPVFVIPTKLIERLVGFEFHRGAIACGYRPEAAKLEDVFTGDAERSTVVIGSGIQDPDNLGSIVRSCAAFGVVALIVGPGCADPFSRRALRVSMGTVFQQTIICTNGITPIFDQLRGKWDFEIAATVLADGAEPLDRVKRSARFALVFGSEVFGLDEELVAQCDRRITLPMSLATDSLNVGVAAGVFLYHFTR